MDPASTATSTAGRWINWSSVICRRRVYGRRSKIACRSSASQLSTGQQQRLCLARALAVEPEVLLGDEPTSALDPISAQRIETQLQALRNSMTIVVVTHLLRQARRLADYVIFLWMGELVEAGPAAQVFNALVDERTRAYLAGDIG